MDRLLEATYNAEQRHFWFAGLAKFVMPLVAQAVAGVSRPEILDAGCGTGANMKRLAAFGRVTGFDLSWSGLEFARAYGQTRLVHASALHIPFADATFDLVTSFDVLSALDDAMERQALAEASRVIRPRGALIVNTAALPALRGQHSVFGREVRRATRPELRRALTAAGFVVERITYTNFSLLPLLAPIRWSQRVMGLSTPEETGADIGVPAAPINAALSGLLAVEAKALRFVDMPLGSSLLALARKR
jgi:SAM-dependent methyltransferase